MINKPVKKLVFLAEEKVGEWIVGTVYCPWTLSQQLLQARMKRK